MQTPTDPYNSADRRPFDDDDEVLAPIESADAEATSKNSAEFESTFEEPVSYANAEALAWEKVFTAESAAVADEPELEVSVDEITAENESEVPLAQETIPAETGAAPVSEQSEENPIAHSAETLTAASAADVETQSAKSNIADGFNTLPDEQRANANLGDVLSAHSPDAAETGNSPEIDDTPAVSIATPLGLAASTTGTSAATSAEAPKTGGFMQPGASADEDAERRARWEQGPSAYAEEEEISLEAPRSRGWAHIGIFFLTLLLIPLTWYLLSDASIRLSVVENNPWDTGVVSFAALFELFSGLVALLMLVLIARASSLGAQIFGFILTVGGLAALIIPNTVQAWLSQLDAQIGGINAFTGNVVHHLGFDLGSGRIAIFGIVLLASGLAAHFARRSGAERATVYERRKALGLDD